MWKKFLRSEPVVLLGALLYFLAYYIIKKYDWSDDALFGIFLTCAILAGIQVIRDFCTALLKWNLFNENLLMLVGAMTAIGTGYYIEGAGAMVFFGVSRLLGHFSLFRSQRAAVKMLDIRPTMARRKLKGEGVEVEPSELRLRHIIIVEPGERVPVDAVVTKGNTTLNTKAITGESTPQAAPVGTFIYSGSVNLGETIEARVRKTYEESVVSKIMELVLSTDKTKGDEEVRLTRFIRYYTFVILLAAVGLAAYPIYFYSPVSWYDYLYRSIILVIAACPCGLLLSAPVAFTGGIRCAAKHGIIVKGGRFLDRLARADTFVFDKTGTLTKGEFGVKKIFSLHMSESQLLEMVAYVESFSNHPISVSVRAAYGQPFVSGRVKRVKEYPGFGMSATFDGKRVHIGNMRMMEKHGGDYTRATEAGTVVYVIVERTFMGYIVLGDTIKEDAKDTLRWLKEKNGSGLIMLTGDSRSIGSSVGKELNMDYVYSSLLPREKLVHMEDMLSVQREGEKVVFVGDGINDAPVLMRADVGIAMGSYGSQAAIEAADIVLMDEGLGQVIDLIRISRETMSVVRQNVSIGMLIKGVVLCMAMVGYLSLQEALLIDALVMALYLWNAAWIRYYPMKTIGGFYVRMRKWIQWMKEPGGFREKCRQTATFLRDTGSKIGTSVKEKSETVRTVVVERRTKGSIGEEEQTDATDTTK